MAKGDLQQRLLSTVQDLHVDLAHHFKCRAPFFGPPHAHQNVYQISYVVTGSCRIEVDGKLRHIGPDDFVFVNPGELHTSLDTDQAEYELVDIKFSRNDGSGPGGLPPIPTVTHFKNSAAVISATERLINVRLLRRSGNHPLVLVYLAELMLLAFEESNRRSGSRPVLSNVELSVRQAADYIALHYDKQITIRELADLVHMSPSHFAAVFKNTMGTSPIEMLIQTRLTQATDLLRHSNFPVKHIAAVCGFGSSQYFARLLLKRRGLSPRDFREGSRG